jgi:hypothetical protein
MALLFRMFFLLLRAIAIPMAAMRNMSVQMPISQMPFWTDNNRRIDPTASPMIAKKANQKHLV